jgi:hypothetical protein
MPPAPIASETSYGPSFVPEGMAMLSGGLYRYGSRDRWDALDS